MPGKPKFVFELNRSKCATDIHNLLKSHPEGLSLRDIRLSLEDYSAQAIKTFIGHLITHGYIIEVCSRGNPPVFGVPIDLENHQHCMVDMNTGDLSPLPTVITHTSGSYSL